MASVADIYRYPVKGMTPQRLERVELLAGQEMPLDRAYAIENGPGRFDPEKLQHLAKTNFLMLMRNERLAGLDAHLDDGSRVLTISRGGRQVARGDLGTPLGRQLIEQFLAAYMQADLRGAPKIVAAEGHSFSDVAQKCLHIINLGSVSELERVAAKPVDSLRFRANIQLEGLPAWAERDWIGQSFRLGGATVEVIDRTVRCEATNVDPTTAKRDMAIPALLQRTWSRMDFGVYAVVTAGGAVATGDVFEAV